jgi:hypothetical protein
MIGTAAGSLVGWSMGPLQADQSPPALAAPARVQPQASNRTAKSDRLASFAKSDRLASFKVTNYQPAAAGSVGLQLASLQPADMPPDEAALALTAKPLAFAPPVQPIEPAPQITQPPAKPERSKTAAAPSNAILDDTQIASIKRRLRLTSQQAQYWPAVESALRDVARQQAIEARKRPSHKLPPPIDVNSAEVQRLIHAAMPLLRQLREDQKREVRALVRVLGLTTVASYI